MRTDLPEPERLINEHLPESIKVLAVKKTTKMFDAKNACSYRTYEYMAPTFAFAPIEQVRLDHSPVIGWSVSVDYVEI